MRIPVQGFPDEVWGTLSACLVIIVWPLLMVCLSWARYVTVGQTHTLPEIALSLQEKCLHYCLKGVWSFSAVQ